MYSHVKNLRWSNSEKTKIDCLVNFDLFPEEYVPFTADPNDNQEYSKEIFNRSINGDFGEILDFVENEPIIPNLTSYQIRSQFNLIGIRQEVESIIDNGPISLQDKWHYSQWFSINDTEIKYLAEKLQINDVDLSAIFINGSIL